VVTELRFDDDFLSEPELLVSVSATISLSDWLRFISAI